MAKLSLEEVKKIPHNKLFEIINKVRQRIKNHPTIQKMLGEYGLETDEIDFIPMCFADLDVSARTDHAIIYFNYKLLEDGDFENDDHYMVHEITHYFQQTSGNGPTQGSEDSDYLDNKEEIEGFQNQTEYLSETRDDHTAEDYIEMVLDHHEVNDENERNKRKDKLLQLARISKFKGLHNLTGV